MLNEDVHDFIALVEGYYRLYVNPHRSLLREVQLTQNNNTDPTGRYLLCNCLVITLMVFFGRNNYMSSILTTARVLLTFISRVGSFYLPYLSPITLCYVSYLVDQYLNETADGNAAGFYKKNCCAS